MFLLEDDVEDAFLDYEDYLNGTYMLKQNITANREFLEIK